MLLKTFSDELELARAFAIVKIAPLDIEALGHGAALSFVGDMDAILLRRSPGEAQVPRTLFLKHFGSITVRGEEVSFEALPDLRRDITEKKLLLGDYLKETVGHARSKHLLGRTWENTFPLENMIKEDSVYPLNGIDLLGKLGADMLASFRKGNRNLKKVPVEKIEEAFCRCVHDAIVCGMGIELPGTGTWNGNAAFEPEESLLVSARLMAGVLVMDTEGIPCARRLIIKPGNVDKN